MGLNFNSKTTKALRYYFTAKESVLSQGYNDEIVWQDSLDLRYIDVKTFYSEYAWVVLSCGMNEIVVRKKFSSLSDRFEFWSNPNKVSKRPKQYTKSGLEVFNHPGKINAIVWMAQYLSEISFSEEMEKIRNLGVECLKEYPFMGPASSMHFAKNIGLYVSKPDRHLVRIAEHLGYKSTEYLCKEISNTIGEKESIIDLILWRYATINKGYLKNDSVLVLS